MKPSEILRSATTPQITGDLIKFQKYETVGGETHRLAQPIFLGKCALGVLACDSGNSYLQLSIDKDYVSYEAILEEYDIDTEKVYPHMSVFQNAENVWDFTSEVLMSVDGIIIRLNDTYELTFKEIAEFLEVTFDL